jgi:hypothetical protein
MTIKLHSSRPASASVLRLIPTINKPLNAECTEVTRKLKAALTTAKSGTTVGALIIALDQSGEWTADLAGRLVPDSDTLCLITCRLLGACLVSK